MKHDRFLQTGAKRSSRSAILKHQRVSAALIMHLGLIRVFYRARLVLLDIFNSHR